MFLRIFSTLLRIFLMLKFALIQFLPTHFLSTYLRTPVNMKQTCYQSSCIFKAALFIMKWQKPHEAATFSQKDFFRISSCLEQLLPSYNYFLVTNIFLNQFLIEDKYFFSKATVSEEVIFSRISNYSEYVLFRSRHSYFFRRTYLLKRVTFFS